MYPALYRAYEAKNEIMARMRSGYGSGVGHDISRVRTEEAQNASELAKLLHGTEPFKDKNDRWSWVGYS